MDDFAVVGSGIGGSSIAALLSAKGYSVSLFEKEAYLGGCSSSFTHKGRLYNTGATTLAGYQEGYIVKEIFDEVGFKPKLIKTDPSIVVVQNSKITYRYSCFEKFMQNLQSNYPHEKNLEFWELVYKINKEFYLQQGHYYSNSNIFSKLKSLLSFLPILTKFQKYLRIDAKSFIDKFFGTISDEYFDFLESQILIVAQAPSKEINFFTAALALGYTFNENNYVVGGFSKVFDGLTKDVKHLHRASEILSIKRLPRYFELYTKDSTYKAKKVILNSTVYDSAKLFDDSKIKNYYKKYEKLNNFQSSFMLYLTVKSTKEFYHHYQLIQEKISPYTLSKALFVSFSDKDDELFSPNGHYSITASIHTDLRFWEDKSVYKAQKKELQDILLKIVLESLDISKGDVVDSFCATPKTFKHFINRSQLGGNAITMKNFLPSLPSNNTKIAGLYNVGDSVYAAQGWPGVMLGVKNLKKLLDV